MTLHLKLALLAVPLAVVMLTTLSACAPYHHRRYGTEQNTQYGQPYYSPGSYGSHDASRGGHHQDDPDHDNDHNPYYRSGEHDDHAY